jgi:hypothetical protein
MHRHMNQASEYQRLNFLIFTTVKFAVVYRLLNSNVDRGSTTVNTRTDGRKL